MTSPAAMGFSCLVSSVGLAFILWHTWHYDRFRCLKITRADWFRGLMCHILLLSIISFAVYTSLEVHVLYAEYYISLQGKVIPVPWQLWSKHHHDLFRTGVFLLALGWGFLQAVHLEEFLYWGYLISSLRSPDGPKTSWLRSPFFKAWVVSSAAGFALLFGAACIETENLDMMKAYLFMCGSAMSVLLALASVVLCMIFPTFIENTRKQGATAEVLDRLRFFSEMNDIRAVFRIIYTLCFFILSADAITKEKRVNKIAFWADTLFILGQLAIFVATCISTIVLLPRNMTSESLPSTQNEHFNPMIMRKRPFPASNTRHYLELGDRLNVDRDAMAMIAESGAGEDHEMSVSPRGVVPPARPSRDDEKAEEDDKVEQDPFSPTGHQTLAASRRAPFAEAADRRRSARKSQVARLPQVLQKFTSPFDTAISPGIRGPTQVFVTTHQEVHRDEVDELDGYAGQRVPGINRSV